MKRSILTSILFTLLICTLPASASAWERSLTCNGEDGVICKEGETPHPLYWSNPCISMYLNETGLSYLNFAALQNIVSKSCKEWSNVSCSNFKVWYAGLTNEDRIGYNPYTGDNANILVFRENDWNSYRSIIGLTTVTFDHSTGEIVDADIEFNAKYFAFSTSTLPGSDKIDVGNTVTHEMGHVLGLAHSYDPDATMFPYADNSDTTKVTLADDDIQAICTIYPSGGKTSSCKAGPAYYEKPPYQMNEKPDSSCSYYRINNAESPILFLFLAFLAAILTKKSFFRSKSR